jgi:hypothetical protein
MDEKFCIRGIEFKLDNLETIKFEKLAENKFAPGHIYCLSKINDNPFFILQAGDWVDHEQLERYEKSGMKFLYMLPVIDEEMKQMHQLSFENLKAAKTETDRWKIRNEIIYQVKTYYWDQSEMSFLNLVQACFKVFNKLDESVFQEYLATSDLVFKRSIVNATNAVIFSLSMGYLDFDFIQDVYHVAFLQDYGLIEPEFNFLIIQALEEERNEPGKGLEFLKNKNVSEELIKFYLNHPVKSYEKVFSNHREIFNFDELIDAIEVHHEKSDGSGFPKGHNYLGISDWESILVLVEYLTPYENLVFTKSGKNFKIISFLKKSKEDKIFNNLPVNRILGMIEAVLKSTQKRGAEVA